MGRSRHRRHISRRRKYDDDDDDDDDESDDDDDDDDEYDDRRNSKGDNTIVYIIIVLVLAAAGYYYYTQKQSSTSTTGGGGGKPFKLISVKNSNLCLGGIESQPANENLLVFVNKDQRSCHTFTLDNDGYLKSSTKPDLFVIPSNYSNISNSNNNPLMYTNAQSKSQKFTLLPNKAIKHNASGFCVHPKGGQPSADWPTTMWNQCEDSSDPSRIQFDKQEIS